MTPAANTVSKPFPKHLMEKSGLLRYAGIKGETRIEIQYDSDSGNGWMNVFIEDYQFDSQAPISDGTSYTEPSKESHL